MLGGCGSYRSRCLGGAPGSTAGGTLVGVTTGTVVPVPDITLTGGPSTDTMAASGPGRTVSDGQRPAVRCLRLAQPMCFPVPPGEDDLRVDGVSAVAGTAAGTIIEFDPRVHRR